MKHTSIWFSPLQCRKTVQMERSIFIYMYYYRTLGAHLLEMFPACLHSLENTAINLMLWIEKFLISANTRVPRVLITNPRCHKTPIANLDQYGTFSKYEEPHAQHPTQSPGQQFIARVHIH